MAERAVGEERAHECCFWNRIAALELLFEGVGLEFHVVLYGAQVKVKIWEAFGAVAVIVHCEVEGGEVGDFCQ